jgi:hypothetical protein
MLLMPSFLGFSLLVSLVIAANQRAIHAFRRLEKYTSRGAASQSTTSAPTSRLQKLTSHYLTNLTESTRMQDPQNKQN